MLLVFWPVRIQEIHRGSADIGAPGLEVAGVSGDLVLPAHFPHPGRIVRDGTSYRFEPVMLDAIAAARA